MATAKKTKPKSAKTARAIQRKKMLYARAAISKVFKKSNPDMVIDPGLSKQSRPHIPTGSIVLDYLIGGRPNRFGVAPCPGWPKGAISNIYGKESSGKTTVALMAAASVIRAGGVVCFIDWEHAIDLNYAKALGVPIDDDEAFYVVQPDTMEDGLKILYIMVKHEVDLVILDSVGAPISEAIDQQKVDEQGKNAQVGWLARAWSQYLPKLVKECGKSGTHVMGISQIREKINTMGFGKKTTEQGGRAWKFYSSVRMSFSPVQSEKGKVYNALNNKVEEQVVARKIEATVDKSKVSQMAHNKLFFWVVFGEGIDNLRSIIEVSKNHGIIKGTSWLAWERSNGDTIKAQGLANFRKALIEANALDELYEVAMQKVQEAQEQGSQMVSHDLDDDGEEIDLDAIMNEASPDFDLESMKEEPTGAAAGAE
jgi:recombination protein RecA